MSNNVICFGDVVKLSAKSAFVETDAETNFVGFVEQKKDTVVLVVPPVKNDFKDKFVEAEFIIAPVRSDKPPANGTPLNYKQPFVLKTSDGSGYSLNNKTADINEAVSLRELSIKGEMYVAVEKGGFGSETQVQDNDSNIEIHVVDSNRIRKKYNNVPLRHVVKAKNDFPGGHVSCGKAGQVLQFKIVKLADKKETEHYIKNPRRWSQVPVDPKADEVSEASVLESPSRAGSLVTAGPLVSEDPVASPPASPTATSEPKLETPEVDVVEATPTPTSAPAAAAPATPVETTVETVAPATVPSTSTPSVEPTPESAPLATTTGVDAAALVAQLEHVVVEGATPVEVVAPVSETLVVSTTPTTAAVSSSTVPEHVQTTLATIELSAASISESDNVDGSVPVHDKLAVHEPKATATVQATEHSELETLEGLPTVPEEHLETACAGKCAIM